MKEHQSHSHHHDIRPGEVASRMSQLGDETCAVHDTVEMTDLREKHDRESILKLAGMLIMQYRYREAAEALEEALAFEPESAGLHLKLAGIYLSLFRYGEALSHYDSAEKFGTPAQKLNFPRGVACYFQSEYEKAAALFADCGLCDGENLISSIYWNTLSCCRAGTEPDMLAVFDPEMDAGHHTAYKDTMLVFIGLRDPADITFGDSELDDAIIQYGLSVYYEIADDKENADKMLKLAAEDGPVWPCIASLAAWNDMSKL